jgi:formylglycine-generating enzyme
MKRSVLTLLLLCSACMGAERMTIESWDLEGGQLEIVFNTLSNSVNHHYWVDFGSSPYGPWTNAAELTVSDSAESVTCSVAVVGQIGYFRASTVITSAVPEGMVWVPLGTFLMGDSTGDGNEGERPVHPVEISTFCIDTHEVSEKLWNEVYHWATNSRFEVTNATAVVTNDYAFANPGRAKASSETNHPIYAVNWYDCVKWCNARTAWFNYSVGTNALTPAYHTSSNLTSEYRTGQVDQLYVDPDASGYRLPTEAEWEMAARGSLATNRFPWGMLINLDYANYYSNGAASHGYDSSTNQFPMYHPDYKIGAEPYTCPVGDLPADGYGLHNMVGNVWEWCWDWHADGYYDVSPDTDPTGPDLGDFGTNRVIRGGSWRDEAEQCRVSFRGANTPDTIYYIGFRTVLPFPSPVSEF